MGASVASPHQAREESLSHDQRVAEVERFDNFAKFRRAIGGIAKAGSHWAGIPMPLDGHRLVVEPRWPHAAEFMRLGEEEPVAEKYPGATVRNQFYSTKARCDIVIFEHEGKVQWGWMPAMHHFSYDLQTLGVSDAWGIEQESKALQLLGTLIKHRAFKQYLLTGMFLESSKRSGLTYCFRKLRPTVVINTHGEETRIMCALCLHPIAYYAGSWGGAMCPTDDVIAHLMLMRGDEPLYWKRSNQHPSYRPEAGL